MMMMLLLLAKRRSCSFSILTCYQKHKVPPKIHQILPRFFSSPPPSQNTRFVVADYLVTTLGFSPGKAAKVSKIVARLKSPEKPDSVIGFLRQQGFSEAEIKTLVTGCPHLLTTCPQTILQPNLRALRDMGLSTTTLNKILLSGPSALSRPSAVPRITFWNDFLGGEEADLVKAFTRNIGLVNHDINQNIASKILLLKTRGFSTKDIGRIVCTSSRFITCAISRMGDLLKRAEDLGFLPGSRMFSVGLQAMTTVTREALQKKFDLFKSFGWSEDDFLSALRKSPHIITHSEENLRPKMNFLLQESRCEHAYIVSYPMLLTYSLEKRMRPRLHVLQLLETKGLCRQKLDFYYTIRLTDKQFVDKYVLPHKQEIERLHEDYLAACS